MPSNLVLDKLHDHKLQLTVQDFCLQTSYVGLSTNMFWTGLSPGKFGGPPSAGGSRPWFGRHTLLPKASEQFWFEHICKSSQSSVCG